MCVSTSRRLVSFFSNQVLGSLWFTQMRVSCDLKWTQFSLVTPTPHLLAFIFIPGPFWIVSSALCLLSPISTVSSPPLSIFLSCSSVYLSVCLSVCLSVSLPFLIVIVIIVLFFIDNEILCFCCIHHWKYCSHFIAANQIIRLFAIFIFYMAVYCFWL